MPPASWWAGAFADGFSLSNTATFSLNEATNNTLKGYNITGQPQTGAGTNTGSDDSF